MIAMIIDYHNESMVYQRGLYFLTNLGYRPILWWSRATVLLRDLGILGWQRFLKYSK